MRENGGHLRHPRLEFDARIPVTQGGTHSLDNTWMICVGEGSCKCHETKTAQEGGGYRSKGRRTADPRPTSRIIWE